MRTADEIEPLVNRMAILGTSHGNLLEKKNCHMRPFSWRRGYGAGAVRP
jgi:hypothetical protein